MSHWDLLKCASPGSKRAFLVKREFVSQMNCVFPVPSVFGLAVNFNVYPEMSLKVVFI